MWHAMLGEECLRGSKLRVIWSLIGSIPKQTEGKF
uniref:Uncharacterized protein n=1 Tax=Arundo donax TaxID=35708 RepID=A0A0A9A443_ARUDO